MAESSLRLLSDIRRGEPLLCILVLEKDDGKRVNIKAQNDRFSGSDRSGFSQFSQLHFYLGEIFRKIHLW